MADYKAMYYHLAGRMATAIDTLDATTKTLEAATKTLEATTQALTANAQALRELSEKLKFAQQTTEEMFIRSTDDDLED